MNKHQSAQSMVEIAVALPFLILIVITLIEMGILFGSYLSLVNAAREGAVFASMYSVLANPTCGSTPYPTCVGTYDTTGYAGTTSSVTIWEEYTNRVANDVFVTVGEPLKAGQLLDQDTLTVDRPILGPTSSSCPTRLEAGCPITVTVHYRIHTFTSDMSLPGYGRFGLPSYYQVDYSVGMPIR